MYRKLSDSEICARFETLTPKERYRCISSVFPLRPPHTHTPHTHTLSGLCCCLLRLRLHLLVLRLLHGPVNSAVRCAAEGAGGRCQRKTLLLRLLLLLGLLGLAEHELSRRRIHLHALRRLTNPPLHIRTPTAYTR